MQIPPEQDAFAHDAAAQRSEHPFVQVKQTPKKKVLELAAALSLCKALFKSCAYTVCSASIERRPCIIFLRNQSRVPVSSLCVYVTLKMNCSTLPFPHYHKQVSPPA